MPAYKAKLEVAVHNNYYASLIERTNLFVRTRSEAH